MYLWKAIQVGDKELGVKSLYMIFKTMEVDSFSCGYSVDGE